MDGLICIYIYIDVCVCLYMLYDKCISLFLITDPHPNNPTPPPHTHRPRPPPAKSAAVEGTRSIVRVLERGRGGWEEQERESGKNEGERGGNQSDGRVSVSIYARLRCFSPPSGNFSCSSNHPPCAAPPSSPVL